MTLNWNEEEEIACQSLLDLNEDQNIAEYVMRFFIVVRKMVAETKIFKKSFPQRLHHIFKKSSCRSNLIIVEQ